MPTTVRRPIAFDNPRVQSLAGNAWWNPEALTAWDAARVEFKKDVDGKFYGTVAIPKNVAPTPNAKVVGLFMWNATTLVSRLSIGTKGIPDDAGLVDFASFTAEASQDITVPGTARNTKRVTFPAAGNLAVTVTADQILVVEFFHEGAHANDTVAVNTLLWKAFLQIDVA